MTVLEIVRLYLVENGYDGLFNERFECACLKDDLAPCGEINENCKAGYKAPCNCGEHDWHIQERKPNETS